MSDNGDYAIQVTLTKGEGWNVGIGTQFEVPALDDNSKLKVVGEMLINLGTRLMGSEVSEEDKYDD